jgi:hypothetical protein
MPLETTNKIRIYKLTDPTVWNENKDSIFSILVNVSGVQIPEFIKPTIDFSINPLCGWIYFAVKNDLWLDVYKQGLSMDANEIRKSADTFIERIKKSCSSPSYLKLKIPPILPNKNTVIRHISTQAVPHNTKAYIDHWLVRYTIELKADDKNGTPIMGSTIDIRVGNNNNIVLFTSNWRPTYLDFIEAEIVSLNQEEAEALSAHHHNDEASHEHTHEHEHESSLGNEASMKANTAKKKPILAPIVYNLEGESVIQNYITPFYKIQQGHHSFYLSASKYSLVISISQENLENKNALCTAFVKGGSGNYVFNWSVWQPDKVWDEGVTTNLPSTERKLKNNTAKPGESNTTNKNNTNTISEVILEPGVHNLIVIVIDTETGVFGRFEQSIYTQPVFTNEPLNV